MPTLEIDGMRFTGTQEECAAFARGVRQPAAASAAQTVVAAPLAQTGTVFLNNPATWTPPLSHGKHSASAATTVSINIEARALTFLRELRDHPEGLESDAVQRAVGATHPKGIGSKIGMINNCLLSLGFKESAAIFTSVRHPLEGRRWFPGPSITDAILVLEYSEAGRNATKKVA